MALVRSAAPWTPRMTTDRDILCVSVMLSGEKGFFLIRDKGEGWFCLETGLGEIGRTILRDGEFFQISVHQEIFQNN